MLLNSMHVHNFHYQMVAGVTILIFLELIIVSLCSLFFGVDNSFLVNATKIYIFKAKDSEIKPFVLC